MWIVVAYLAGVFLGIPLVWFLTRKLGSSREAGLGSRLMRMGLRCLALSLAFAPTGITAGYVGFVFPASVVVALSLRMGLDFGWIRCKLGRGFSAS